MRIGIEHLFKLLSCRQHPLQSCKGTARLEEVGPMKVESTQQRIKSHVVSWSLLDSIPYVP